jgi:hypothetical protein
MRRDYFTLDATRVDSEGVPTVHIEFEGPDGQLRDRLTHDGEFLDAGELDVAYRLQTPVDDDATGVVAVTNRLTGEYILELNADADDVLRFIAAARERQADGDDEARYRVEVSVDGEDMVDYEKQVFLVYDVEGGLLRGRSLIPSGVEL